jgi:NUMOD4 motif/HNH endonuclease
LKKFSAQPGEKWVEMKLRNRLSLRRYAVSSHGRVASFKTSLEENGKFLSVYAPPFRLQKVNILFNDGKKGFPVHKLVANHFIEKPSKEHTYVLHVDKNLHNNHVSNLKWATFDEATRHFSGKAIASGQKIKFGAKEEYKIVKIPGLKKKYAITNTGRLISFAKNIEDGTELSLNIHPQGYRIWRFRVNGESTHFLVHRLVAEYFLKKPSKEHDYVIHVDHSKTNNSIKNLKWVTYDEQRLHSAQSDASKANAVRLSQWSRITGKGKKLTEAKVRQIKKILDDPKQKVKMKEVAEKFEITPMQLYRIKNGDNWGWVKSDKAKAEAPAKEAKVAVAKKSAAKKAAPKKATAKKAAPKKAAKKK